MSEESETQDDGGTADAAPNEQQERESHRPEGVGPDPSEGIEVEAAPAAQGDPDVERSEGPSEPTDGPSIEDEVRRMASEEPQEEALPPQEPIAIEAATADQPSAEDQAPLFSSLSRELESNGDGEAPEERQMEREAAETLREEERAAAPAPPVTDGTKAVVRPPAVVPMAAAHEAFSRAIRAHAQAKGLDLIEQSSFLQLLHRATGHKIYMALAQKTRLVHIETTMPVVGMFGAIEPKAANGRIAAIMDPPVDNGDEIRNVLSLIDMLASGQYGQLPPPRAKSASTR